MLYVAPIPLFHHCLPFDRVVPMSQARVVDSNQSGIHPDLEWAVRRHMEHPGRRPVAEHTQEAFARAMHWWDRQQLPLILDTGCGTGMSSQKLSLQYPDHAVIGIDKSEIRLGKADLLPPNCLLLRAELQDFWYLLQSAGIRCARQYLLYPNPWPKAHDFMRRWQAHPVFPRILAAGGILELRTNWEIYAEEFALACQIATGSVGELSSLPCDAQNPLTAFERKYVASGQAIWRYTIALPGS